MIEMEDLMGKIVAKCWEDEAFKKQLMADPAKILKAEGLKIPEGISITVLQEKENEILFVIPKKPANLGNYLFPKGCHGGACTMEELV